jgi:hypothetical protein
MPRLRAWNVAGGSSVLLDDIFAGLSDNRGTGCSVSEADAVKR